MCVNYSLKGILVSDIDHSFLVLLKISCNIYTESYFVDNCGAIGGAWNLTLTSVRKVASKILCGALKNQWNQLMRKLNLLTEVKKINGKHWNLESFHNIQ